MKSSKQNQKLYNKIVKSWTKKWSNLKKSEKNKKEPITLNFLQNIKMI